MASSDRGATSMTQAKPRFVTFEEYLSYGDLEGRYELIAGELVELPPESGLNDWIALNLRDLLMQFIRRQLLRIHTCEVQVPVLRPKDAANRFPDLVVLREEHLPLTEKRLTITLDMPPPQLIAEIVSPGKTNRDRDYINKRSQYAAIGVSEYWLISPSTQTILVLTLQGDDYEEVGTFGSGDRVTSLHFLELVLTADQVFQA
jgi:Uma2 family endonuclease